MKVILTKCGDMIANLAFLTAKISANQACGHVYYQPEVPEKAKKLRKF